MGKIQAQGQIQGAEEQLRRSPFVFCGLTCTLAGIARAFSLRCILFLILGVAVSISALLWLPPFRHADSGLDISYTEKLRAPVQARFNLQRPVSMLESHIERLEHDIFEELVIPNTKVSIISVYPLDESNFTSVVFAVLPVSREVPIGVLPLSILKSSMIELVLQRSTLLLSTSIFGLASSFEVLKFPGGITLIPGQSAPFWQLPQVLFNFTLVNSISQIQQNVKQLRHQLKYGLLLRPDENVYVKVTNLVGSTASPPVIVQASIMPDVGGLSEQRLRELAQVIRGSGMWNLGLDYSVFGNVKLIQLSTYLEQSLAPSPSPSPSPSEGNPPRSSPSPYPMHSGERPDPAPPESVFPSAPAPGIGRDHSPPHIESPSPSVETGSCSPRQSPSFSPARSPNHSPLAHSERPSDRVPTSSSPDTSRALSSLPCLHDRLLWRNGVLVFVISYLLRGLH